MKRLSVSELREADLYTYAGRVSVPSGSECWQVISAHVGFGIFPLSRLPYVQPVVLYRIDTIVLRHFAQMRRR
jgi:hypothetical protein